MPLISINAEIKQLLPHIKLGCLEAQIQIEDSSAELNQWINQELSRIEVALTPETIRQTETVKATKDAYRALGKDPNRYRPAAEALMRRIANGKGLYQISNAVDILNFISIKTGFSICGYDAQLIEGDIILGIGEENEPYEGIGRGQLNIERLPVFRDNKGAFGTPTSDSTRTMISSQTNNILFIFIGLDEHAPLKIALEETAQLLSQYACAENIKTYYI